ncbi:MAG: phosphoribosylamine--glycine ligase [Deltaproteobacteria bacterium]|jgi:phosphoribosylamine--glycine ligase|nr:phosphoribosylamine--glycine ligase [Deltaproteobacteria bacterium]
MKILLIGSGGREHALAWRLKQTPGVTIISAPGSSALANLGEVKPVAVDDIKALTSLAKDLKPDLTVIGPELPLVLGLADSIRALGLPVFGPSIDAARIEGSKVFAKDFMVRHNLPTASYAVFYDPIEAKQYLKDSSYPVVIKADGLASGKGVFICGKLSSALDALTELSSMEAASRIIVEEYLAGEEVSFFALTDGTDILPLATAQDHKAVFDGDRGPNTGGMGAYSPAPLVNDSMEKLIIDTIIKPTVDGLRVEGSPFAGLLYAGLMITLSGPKILEFNARFGDPETQALMPRLKGDLAQALLCAATGRLKEASLSWDNRFASCVIMCAEGYPGNYRRGDIIEGLEAAVSQENVTIFESGVTREPRKTMVNGAEKWVETAITNGGRVLGVAGLGDDLETALKNTYETVDKISWPGVHFRRDIGSKALHPGPLYPMPMY